MTITALRQQLGIESPFVVPQPLPSQYLRGLQAPLSGLLNSIRIAIRDNTLTVAQIDAFIQENLDLLTPSKKKQILGFLLSKKAFLLFRDGHEEEGLEFYEESLKVNEAPSTWALKGTALLQMERLDEAFQSFKNAFSLRDYFGPQRQEYLKDLIGGWSTAALIRGLYGILEQNVTEAQKGVEEYISILNQAKDERLQTAVVNLAVEEPVEQNLRDALEELELMVRLLSIKDPFEGWRELTKEISKVWPKGVSAVDAVREQRQPNWQT